MRPWRRRNRCPLFTIVERGEKTIVAVEPSRLTAIFFDQRDLLVGEIEFEFIARFVELVFGLIKLLDFQVRHGGFSTSGFSIIS